MIINNLAVLMKERNIKNVTLSARTGISKNSISQLSNNNNSMILLETINKLCQELNVTPDEFFEYSPYDVSFKYMPPEDEEAYAYFIEGGLPLDKKENDRFIMFDTVILIHKNQSLVDEIVLGCAQEESENDSGIYQVNRVAVLSTNNNKTLDKYFSTALKYHVVKMLENYLKDELSNHYELISDDFSVYGNF